jgi:hypothetical protein
MEGALILLVRLSRLYGDGELAFVFEREMEGDNEPPSPDAFNLPV